MLGDPIPEQGKLHLSASMAIMVDSFLLAVEALLCIKPPSIGRAPKAEDTRVMHGEMVIGDEVYPEAQHCLTDVVHEVTMTTVDIFHRNTLRCKGPLYDQRLEKDIVDSRKAGAVERRLLLRTSRDVRGTGADAVVLIAPANPEHSALNVRPAAPLVSLGQAMVLGELCGCIARYERCHACQIWVTYICGKPTDARRPLDRVDGGLERLPHFLIETVAVGEEVSEHALNDTD